MEQNEMNENTNASGAKRDIIAEHSKKLEVIQNYNKKVDLRNKMVNHYENYAKKRNTPPTA